MPYKLQEEKTTNLHFFFHVTLSGKTPHVVLVSRPNTTKDGKSVAPFGIIFAIDDPLTEVKGKKSSSLQVEKKY